MPNAANVATYDDAVVTYDSLEYDYDGNAVLAQTVGAVGGKLSKRKTRIEDYLGVGNALIHR